MRTSIVGAHEAPPADEVNKATKCAETKAKVGCKANGSANQADQPTSRLSRPNVGRLCHSGDQHAASNSSSRWR
jgi:hypothetical protein